ncbi:hypothetical protein HMPREF1477_01155 [Veillonella sp. HPA0037]|uniref:hypothetical protein n=1 Tax=Veillonella TaxID=29465 RepID=UPI00034E0208|nr:MULTISPECIES: hypothetical protein [Veillonella]EPD79525.1 hypothetical protein HMPREF1477_01155 [Veillonella sp. HPA0037]MBF1755789.1 hypothetical protein [Veillonella sp.]
MHILIDRDAVCAADDMNHHREEFTVPNDITIAGLFELLEFKYIPFIAGNDVVWGLYHHDVEVGTYFTKIQSFINGNMSLSSIISDSERDTEFYLRYYSSPDSYRKHFINIANLD